MQKILTIALMPLLILLFCLPANAQETEKGRAYYDFGVFAHEDGDYKDAEENFRKALEFDPNNPFYNHYLGKTYLETERYQKAMTYFMKAWQTDANIPELKYDVAMLHYKTSDYAKATDLFKTVAAENSSDVLASYYAGISLYKQKQYKAASEYLLRSAEKSPSLRTNAYYHAGICCQKMGKTEKAVKLFQQVRDEADAGELRENATRWLQAIHKKQESLQPLSLRLRLGYRYDDNVRLSDQLSDQHAEGDDSAAVAYFLGRYNFINGKEFKMGAGYSHHQTWHSDLDEYDVTASIFSLYMKYYLDSVSFGLTWLPAYYWVDADSYLRRHQIKPEMVWQATESLTTRLSYSYYNDEYFENSGRDADIHDVSLDVYYSLLDKRMYLFGGMSYASNSASDPDRIAAQLSNYTRLKTTLGLAAKLPWNLELTLTGKYYDKQYDNTDPAKGLKREDDKYVGSVSLSRKLFYDWLGILGEFSYSKNDSTIPRREYERNMATLSLTAEY